MEDNLITEDKLIKLGFTKVSMLEFLNIEAMFPIYFFDGVVRIVNVDIEIKTISTLKNVFNELTNKELNYAGK